MKCGRWSTCLVGKSLKGGIAPFDLHLQIGHILSSPMIKHSKNIPKPWWNVLDRPVFRKETLHLEPQLPRELQAVQGLWQVKSGLRVRIDRDQAGAAGGFFPHLPGEGLYTPFLAPCSCGLRTRSLYCQLRMLSTPGPEHMPERIQSARQNVKT